MYRMPMCLKHNEVDLTMFCMSDPEKSKKSEHVATNKNKSFCDVFGLLVSGYSWQRESQ